VFGRERAERERAESPSAEAERNLPSSIFSVWGREDVGGLLTVSQNLMDKFADCEQMDEYPDINCLAGDTKVYIAEGSVIKPAAIHDLAAEGGGYQILAYDLETSKLVLVQGENPRLTANNIPVIAIKLSNGETIKCTKDHKFLKHGTGYVNAELLKKDDKIVSSWAGFSTSQLSIFSYPAAHYVTVVENPSEAGVTDVYDVTTKTHNFVANGVVVHNSANHYFTNDATQPDIDTGRTVWVHSNDHALKELAETLLHKRLKIEDEIWSIVYTTVKYGNDYEEVLVTENGVIGLNALPVPTMRRVEQANGSLIGYVQDITGKFTQDAADLRGMLAGQTKIPDHVALFEEWQVLHTRLRGTTRRSPYGVSISDGARWIWKRLVLLEDAMLIYKLCLRGDSQIWTPGGRKAIKDLNEGDEVYSYTTEDKLKKTKVVYKKHNGQDQIYRVHSDHREIFANKTHPVLVERIVGHGSGKPRARIVEYVEVQNLIPGVHSFMTPKKNTNDWEEIRLKRPELHTKATLTPRPELQEMVTAYAVSKKINHGGSGYRRIKEFLGGHREIKTETVMAMLKGSGYTAEDLTVKEHWSGAHGDVVRDVTIPEFVDEDFAQWFGFMLGDGYITTRHQTDGFVTTNEVGFSLGDDTTTNEKYKKLFEKYVPHVKLVGDSGGRLGAYSFISCKFAEFMLMNGFIQGAHNKRLPEWIYRAKPSIKLALIRGLADADAHIKPRKNGRKIRYECARFEMCNRALLEDVRELAMQLGLVTTFVRSRVRKGGRTIEGHKKPLPTTTAYQLDISFKSQPISERIRGVTTINNDDIWDIGVEADEHNFIANGVCLHNTRAPARFAFYIDVTDIPGDKVESFLRKAKQDLRKQKMVNPRCLTAETPVTCLDGKDRSMRELAEEVPKLAAEGKHHYVFSYDVERNRVVPGKIVGAALSGQKKPVYRVLLDNGAIVRCTGDHPFLLRNGTYKQAQDLVRGESLMPLYLSRNSGDAQSWTFNDPGLHQTITTDQMLINQHSDNNQILSMMEQRLHQSPDMTYKAMISWLNLQSDFKALHGWLDREGFFAILNSRGLPNFEAFRQQTIRLSPVGQSNHNVISVTPDGLEDVYDLTVERYHNFALTAGVFVHNTQRLDMRFNPMDNSEDFFIAVREGRELARVEVLQGPDYQATDDVDYFARKLHGVLKVPRSYLGQDDAVPGKSILCLTGDTEVPLLDGRTRTLEELTAEYHAGGEFYVYSIGPDGSIIPGRAHTPRLTRPNAETFEVTLDNGEVVKATPDHPFMMRDGSYRRLDDLKVGDSLMPLYRHDSKASRDGIDGYDMVLDPVDESWKFTHRLAAKQKWPARDLKNERRVVHHVDFNKRNNDPRNLSDPHIEEHLQIHRDHCDKTLRRPEVIAKAIEASKWWTGSEENKAQCRQNLETARAPGGGQDAWVRSGRHRTLKSRQMTEQWSGDSKLRARTKTAEFSLSSSEKMKESIRLGKIKVRGSDNIRFRTDASFARLVDVATSYHCQTMKDLIKWTGYSSALIYRLIKDAGTSYKEFANNHLGGFKPGRWGGKNHKIVSIRPAGRADCYDFVVDDVHNYALNAGVFVHNSNEDVRAARVTMGVQREVRNSIRRLVQIDLAARGIDPFKHDLQVMMTVPSGIYELAHMEVKNARADFAGRIQPFVSKRYIQKVVFKMSDEEIDILEKEIKKEQEEQAAQQQQQQQGGAPGGAAPGPLQMPDTSGALTGAPGAAAPPPGSPDIGPPPGTAGRPNTAGEWKNFDNARRLEERKEKLSEKRHDEIMDTLVKVVSTDRAFASRLNQTNAFLQEFRHTAFAKNGNGSVVAAPRGRGHKK
jgi:intein/homing endonuclease